MSRLTVLVYLSPRQIPDCWPAGAEFTIILLYPPEEVVGQIKLSSVFNLISARLQVSSTDRIFKDELLPFVLGCVFV